MLKKTFASLLFAMFVNLLSAQNNIAVFDECYYKGTAAYLVPGSYRASSMGLKNDKISAMQIPKGMRVTVYTDDNFRGNSLTYTADIDCLPVGMNDNVSSIVIESIYNYQPQPGQDYVTFANDCNGKGYTQSLRPGIYTASKLGALKLNISSFTISGNLRVRVFVNNDDASGYGETFETSQSCLGDNYNDRIRSLVVEYKTGVNNNYPNTNYPNNNNSQHGGFVTFFYDCNSKGYSKTLYPGTYTGEQLGLLKENISSFNISGNVRVKVYTTSDNASGYSTTFESSQSCLGDSYNDRIRSLTIEYGNYGNNNNNYPDYNNNGNSYATIYTDCNYRGNSLRLGPGTYTGDKLGLLKYDISSIEIPNNLRAKVYINNEYLSGNSYTITENTNCLSSNLNNRIGSILIEEKNGWGNNPNNNYPNTDEKVILYADANFKGLSAAVLPGNYATMAQAGFIDDNLSSLYLPAGYRVVLYEYENFKGKTYTITATKSSFSLSNWNDRASSIAIYRN